MLGLKLTRVSKKGPSSKPCVGRLGYCNISPLFICSWAKRHNYEGAVSAFRPGFWRLILRAISIRKNLFCTNIAKTRINLLSPARYSCANSKHNMGIHILRVQINLTLEWMPEDLVYDKSTLVLVVAWRRQSAMFNLNQCRPRSPTLHDVTKPEWVKRWMVKSPWILVGWHPVVLWERWVIPKIAKPDTMTLRLHHILWKFLYYIVHVTVRAAKYVGINIKF